MKSPDCLSSTKPKVDASCQGERVWKLTWLIGLAVRCLQLWDYEWSFVWAAVDICVCVCALSLPLSSSSVCVSVCKSRSDKDSLITLAVYLATVMSIPSIVGISFVS